MDPAILQPHVLDRDRTPYEVAALWDADADSVEHVSTAASFRYRLRIRGRPCYLRLTPPGWQTLSDLRGELSFIRAVRNAGIAAPLPVLSTSGREIEVIESEGNSLFAVVFEKVPGQPVAPEDMDAATAMRLGRLLGEMHNAAPRDLPRGETRRDWRSELRRWSDWTLASDPELQDYVEWAARLLRSLPEKTDIYGLIHFDVQSDNVFWQDGSAALIDFDDCMFNWFAADIARTLSEFRAARREAQRAVLLDGYRQVRELDPVTSHVLPDFERAIDIGSLIWLQYSRIRGLPGDPQLEATLRGMLAGR